MVLGAVPLSLFTPETHRQTTTMKPILASGVYTPGPLSVESSSRIELPPHTLGAPLSVNKTFNVWWDPNWHYRIPMNVTGTGNVSTVVNFTKHAASLQVTNKIIETSTLRVIRYRHNGSVDGVVTVFNFTYNTTQNVSGHNPTNGTLTWQVDTSSSSLYYVYFDVTINTGTRTPLTPTSNLSASGSAQISTVGPAEGWWSVWAQTLKYYLPGQPVTFAVNTTAKATSVSAVFWRNGVKQFTKTFVTLNHLHWTNSTSFNQPGNWTIKVNSSDAAGYKATELAAEFYVGKPDLTVTNFSVLSAPYFKGKTLIVRANVTCRYTTVTNVSVSLFAGSALVDEQHGLTFLKNHPTTVNLTWQPTKKETVTLTVSVDYNNDIDESNEANNDLSMNLDVQGVPELGVVSITVPSEPVLEGDPATIYTSIRNNGDADAVAYNVKLYLKQTNTDSSPLNSKEKDSIYVNISMNEIKNVSLVWSKVEYGDSAYNGLWAAGIRIVYDEIYKPDNYTGNNTRARFDRRLKVTPGDRTPPYIRNQSDLRAPEQRAPVEFLFRVVDNASEVASVTIAIKTPQNKYITGSMDTRGDTLYRYTLQDTSLLGKYTFVITAVDTAFYNNKQTFQGGFTVGPDRTPPTIEYADAYPRVQLVNATVEFQCIASDYTGVSGVNVTINLSGTQPVVHHLNESNDQTYRYTGRFDRPGKYEYTITATDLIGNAVTTDPETFWITTDLNDTDHDGMPDDWETQHHLNPYDPADANLDADQDGATNLAEYKAGTDPNDGVTPRPNVLRDNWPSLVGVLGACVVIGGVTVYYRSRRKKR